MAANKDSEVLAHEPESWRPGRKARAVAVLVLILCAIGVVADRKARADEAAALAACAEAIDSAISSALGPVDSMVEYVRVTRSGATAELSRELEALVAGQTLNASARLEPAVAACSEIRVLSHHFGQRDRKRKCLARLDVAAEYFADIGRDGSVAFRPRTFDRGSTEC